MITLREKMGLSNRQRGLASVEAVLIMPILLMLMYIMVQSAKTMVVYEQRTIESRNAAYTVELYSGGEVRQLDEIRQSADEAVQGIEEGLVAAIAQANTASEYLNLIGINLGEVGDHVQSDYLTILQRFPIQRYAVVSEESTWFYESMIKLSRDDMDEYSSLDDPDIMTDKIKGLYQVLDNDYSMSGLTVGVSFSPYTGPLGVFAPFSGHFFMRNYHVADFATTLALDDITINNQEVIDTGYVLKAGYSKEMKQMLDPDIIFNNLFADSNNQPIDLPGVWDLPLPEPVDPTVGVIVGGDGNFTDPETQAGWDRYVAAGGTYSADLWLQNVWNGTEDPLDSGANFNTAGNSTTLGGNLTPVRYPNDWEPAHLRGQVVADQEAHHIIPSNEPITQKTARRLAMWGIDMDSEINGIYLPKTSGVSVPPSDNPEGRTFHNITRRQPYLNFIERTFANVTTAEQARAKLAVIKQYLMDGETDFDSL